MIWRLILFGSLTAVGFGQSYSTNGDSELDHYIQQALERNPTVRQAFFRYQAHLQRLPQVRSLPDPMLALTQHVRTPETRVGPQTTMLTLSQRFPWFGKLSAREKVAAKEAMVFREKHEASKAEVVRQVKLAYYNLAYIDRAILITREDQSILEHYEGLARARYSQGVGLQQAVVKLQAEITRDRNRLEALRSQRIDAETVLNTLMDQPAGTAIEQIGPRQKPRAEIDPDRLNELGRIHRPEVRAALLEVERDDQNIQLAQKGYWPDLTLGASLINVMGRSDPAGLLNPPSQNGKNVYSFSVGLNLPIRRRRYDAAVLEATQAKIASREAYRSLVNSVEAAIRAVGFRIQTLQEQISLFERALLPQAEQALRTTEGAYSTGTLGVLDLLDSERVLLDVRLGLARLDSDYMKSLAEMERAIGVPF